MNLKGEHKLAIRGTLPLLEYKVLKKNLTVAIFRSLKIKLLNRHDVITHNFSLKTKITINILESSTFVIINGKFTSILLALTCIFL